MSEEYFNDEELAAFLEEILPEDSDEVINERNKNSRVFKDINKANELRKQIGATSKYSYQPICFGSIEEIIEFRSKRNISFTLNKPENVFYKKVLCPTLQQAINDNLSAPIADQLSLLEELALFRETATIPIDLYSKSIECIEKTQHDLLTKELTEDERKKKEISLNKLYEIKSIAADSVVKTLERVGHFCEKAARVDALQRDKFSIHSINNVVVQISQIAQKVFQQNGLQHLAEEFDTLIRDNLVLPIPLPNSSAGSDLATNLTPDMVEDLVKEMDSFTAPTE